MSGDRPVNVDTLKILELRSIDIVEWHPERDGRGKPTQVHMLLDVEGTDLKFVLRFKGRDTLDKIRAALKEHADAVFGK